MIIPSYKWLAALSFISVTSGVVFLFIIGAGTLILADQQAEERKVREELSHAKIMITMQGELITDLRGECERE